MAIGEAMKEAIWLHGLIANLGIHQDKVGVFCDSQSAIHLVKNQVHPARTKHVDVCFHFVQEIVDVWKIGTVDNPVGMLTKVVSGVKFKHCLHLANIVHT